MRWNSGSKDCAELNGLNLTLEMHIVKGTIIDLQVVLSPTNTTCTLTYKWTWRLRIEDHFNVGKPTGPHISYLSHVVCAALGPLACHVVLMPHTSSSSLVWSFILFLWLTSPDDPESTVTPRCGTHQYCALALTIWGNVFATHLCLLPTPSGMRGPFASTLSSSLLS